MGPFIALVAVVSAGAAVLTARPSNEVRTHRASSAVSAHRQASDSAKAIAAAERDFAKRQKELGLVGAAPLFGAEGLPKPATR
jgi:hypothetical protein